MKKLIDEYAAAYDGSDMTDEEIFEEILCDSVAEINAFGRDYMAQKFQKKIAQLVEQDTGREDGARAPPKEGLGHFSIERIIGNNGDYGMGVYLDTKLFDNVKPRDWGKVLGKFVYEKLAGTELTMYDQDGNAETVHLARVNDRVKKDGANNSHKVIDKLARYKGDNVKALATVHLSELLETSGNEQKNPSHNHQWLDENGWIYCTSYLMDQSGAIYEATLNIADGRNGKILYEINKIKRVDAGVVPSTVAGRGSLRTINSSEDSVAKPPEKVKGKTSREAVGAAKIEQSTSLQRQQLEYWLGKPKKRNGQFAKPEDVRRVARNIIGEYQSKVDKTETIKAMQELADLIIREGDEIVQKGYSKSGMTYDEIRAKSADIAWEIVGNSQSIANESDLELYSY